MTIFSMITLNTNCFPRGKGRGRRKTVKKEEESDEEMEEDDDEDVKVCDWIEI